MIPKIIHYCWFGKGPLPNIAEKCIESWKRYFPDYEIWEWNEDNYDYRKNKYISAAYDEKKYAFVSDYARFDVLYHYGGIYFDVDVEVIKNMDPIINAGPFMGCERNDNRSDILVAPGLGMAAEAGMELLKTMLDIYDTLSFYDHNGMLNQKTIVAYTTDELVIKGLNRNQTEIQKIAGFFIYPWYYFCPMDAYNGRINISENTYSIHHYLASWHSSRDKRKRALQKVLGPKVTALIVKIKAFLRG